MSSIEVTSLSALGEWVDRPIPPSDWLSITQERIDRFAEATGDEQWIHVDPHRAKTSPLGKTVAHGFLTLSLLSRFLSDTIHVHGVRMGINYGLNRVRFTSMVPVGARLRAHFNLASLEPIEGGAQLTWTARIEQEGESKPCCVAEWVTRRYALG